MPKRRIEAITSKFTTSIQAAAGFETLHNAEDSKTLVRTIIDLVVTKTDGTAGSSLFNLLLGHNPRGQVVISPSITQSLDQPKIKNQLWEHLGQMQAGTDASIFVPTYNIFVDLKSMRKMQETDTITIGHLCTANDDFTE